MNAPIQNRFVARVVGLVASVIALSISVMARADKITYYHNDLLGSPVVATNETGQVLWHERYGPYGERQLLEAASAKDKIWFTSRHEDENTELVYMGARYYDPMVGRFMSTDEKGFDATNIHSFNRYAYANNNPYRYLDPDGRSARLAWLLGKRAYDATPAIIAGLGIIGGMVGAAAWDFRQYILNQSEGSDSAVGQGKSNDSKGMRGAQDALMPGGEPVGDKGSSENTRVVSGGQADAQELFDSATRGGKVVDKPSYPGTLVEVPGGGTVGIRPNSGSGGPAIDVNNVPGVPFDKVHFRPK